MVSQITALKPPPPGLSASFSDAFFPFLSPPSLCVAQTVISRLNPWSKANQVRDESEGGEPASKENGNGNGAEAA